METILRPHWMKSLLLVLMGILGVVVFVWLAKSGEILGWFFAVFFGLATVITAAGLLPNGAYLRLTSEGFEIREAFRSSFISWGDVDHFSVGTIGNKKFVIIHFSPTYETGAVARLVAKSISGSEGILPDTYRKTAEELAQLMNQWKEILASQTDAIGA